MPSLRLASPLTFDSVVDGPGLRCVIWFQGCTHACPGCHNNKTHDLQGGFEMNIDDIVGEIKKDPMQTGITISGGEPFLQPEGLLMLLQAIVTLKKNIWVYTGFTLEELTREHNPFYETNMRILGYLKVLVDGRFQQDQRDLSLLFRGSTNQRLIDVPRTAWANEVVLWIT